MIRVRKILPWLILSCCVSGAAASAQGERVLRFPSTYAAGKVYCKDRSQQHHTLHFDHRQDGVTWRFLSVAQGRVPIPAGQDVYLQLHLPGLRHPYAFDFLGRFEPDDLFMLSSVNDACIPRIIHLQGLRWIHFSPGIAPTALGSVARLEGLERVYLPAGITDSGLAEIAKCRGLKGLYFDKNWVTGAGIAHLALLTDLEELELGGEFMGDEALKVLSELDHLRYLSLWGSFSDEALQYLSFGPALETVRINITTHKDGDGVWGITDEGLRHLALSLTIKDISLGRANLVTGEGLRHLRGMTPLRKLDISATAVNDADLAQLAAFSRLEYLHLPNAGITDRGIRHLLALKGLRTLSVGCSPESTLSDEALKVIACMEDLESLAIGGSKLSNLGLGLIGTLTRLCDLRVGTGVPVSDRGIEHLNRLTDLRSLTFLAGTIVPLKALSGLKLKKLERLECARLVRDSPAMRISALVNLRQLNLTSAADPSGVHGFRDQDLYCLRSLEKLQVLQLQGPGITDEGIRHLADLNNLEVLTLGGSDRLTDAGLALLPGAKLQHLTIEDSRIRDQGLKALYRHRALGTLRISSPVMDGRAAAMELNRQLPLLTQLRIN